MQPTDPTGAVLRAPEPRDVDAVVGLWLEQPYPEQLSEDDLRERATRWFVPDRDDLQLVYERDGEVLGWARAAFMDTVLIDERPENCVPPMWYLLGLNVSLRAKRQGIGRVLTQARMHWLAGKTDVVGYFTDETNAASRALHEPFGFEVLQRDVWFPGKRDPASVVLLLTAAVGSTA